MNVKKFELILKTNGDIEIYEIYKNSRICVSHKSYNLGDDLRVNLNYMYDYLVKLEELFNDNNKKEN